jgi:L-ribulose-5-phosphate 4-epimerase
VKLHLLREELVRLHAELPRHNLVVWTGGTAASMVVLDLDGTVVDGNLKPSSDVLSHLHVYRHRPDVNGVVHTHSRYATAFAAVGRSIPVYLTAQADEFGGEIPCSGFAMIGTDAIGAEIVAGIGTSPAILLRNHGVFTIGPTAEAAVKAAVMVEDIAATVWAALQIGTPDVLSDEIVAGLHDRYMNVYGQ